MAAATRSGGQLSFRAPFPTRARYTVDGVTNNDLAAARLKSQPPDALATPRRLSWRPTRQTRAREDDGEADLESEDEDEDEDRDELMYEEDASDDDDKHRGKGSDLLKLADDLRAFRFELKDDSPNLVGVSNKHSEHDKNLLYVIRAVVSETLGIKKTPGQGNTIVYSDFRDPPAFSNPELLTPDNIVIGWDLGMAHPFNRRATQLLADKVISHPDWVKYFKNVTDPTRHGIAIAVNNHLKYLAKIYNQIGWARSQVTDEQQAALKLSDEMRKESRAADERRRTLHRWRKDTCLFYHHNDWAALLDHATAGSMSSDDNSERNKQRLWIERVYYVSPKSWRHPDFIRFLRILDRIGRHREKGTKTKGRPLRTRRLAPSDLGVRESIRKPTPRLVEQMYSIPVRKQHGLRHRYPTVQIVTLEQALIDVVALALSLRVVTSDI